MSRFFRHHGLSLAMFGMFLLLMVGQVLTGRLDYNEKQRKNGEPEAGFFAYLKTGHFQEATAENWESEFFQMFVFVLATAFLYQKGSAESKDPDEPHSHHTGRPKPNSPWPTRRGGWACRLYEHSLSLALFLLFLVSFLWHASGGLKHYNEERLADGESAVSLGSYLGSSRFWFESFQNWQSEFLAIFAMVVLSIFLREANSPESKKVETPTWENED